jgi:predicted lipid-binding transport protein (Tim44 family)
MKTTKSLSTTLVLALTLACALAACQTNTQPVSNIASPSPATTTAVNSNQPANTLVTANTNASQQAIVTTESDNSPVGSLATPTEAYKTAYAARQKKDLNGLKRVMSKKLTGFLESMGESEKKTLDDELKEMVEQPQAPTAEARNEKINGDTATLEYPDETGKWKTMDFVKEGNDWKLTLPPSQPPTMKEMNKKHQ